MSKNPNDPINPNYYTKGIEVTKFAQSHGLSFAEGNIVKYIVRHKYKNGVEDLRKAKKYIELLMDNYEKNLSKKINTGNWRTCANKGFMYTGLNDPDYIKDKKEFLAKNGNGWWYTQGVQRREGY